jgi:hypothetical protein
MSSPFTRIGCPKCDGVLSRTLFYPRWPIYEFQFPPFRVPTVRICTAIVVVGFGLAFIHLALSVLALAAIANWFWWTYYGALQCDKCGEYFISGQFAGGKGRRVPWRASDSRQLILRTSLALLVILTVSIPFFVVDRVLESRCSADCGSVGLRGESDIRGLRCRCVK